MYFATQVPQITGSAGRLDLMDHPLGARGFAVVQKRFKTLLEARKRRAIADRPTAANPVPET